MVREGPGSWSAYVDGAQAWATEPVSAVRRLADRLLRQSEALADFRTKAILEGRNG